MLEKAFLTKADSWAYEDEWRIIKRKMTSAEIEAEARRSTYLSDEDRRLMTDQHGHGFYKFRPQAIDSVTMGMRISASDKKGVVTLIREAGLSIPIYKVHLPTTSYRLTRKLVKRGL